MIKNEMQMMKIRLHIQGILWTWVNPQDDDNMSYLSAEEDEAPYSGPVTRSRAKPQEATALSKASNLIASYSSDWFIVKSAAHAIAGTASKWFK